ncbi:amidoligase family protein [Marivibrio halodurans]|uniref:Amidoligase family protein n=1 Tax=Marivibrio halodurans TaxID=2039722 RepID=A0A8J7S1M6_9PROT|nr:amidoligase family protein [Marivibrio halodurans]MBP5858220.1 amidoligase family protein [Marivibrio halodurans]
MNTESDPAAYSAGDATERRIAGSEVLAPPRPDREDGAPRRCGVEIECIALDVRTAADLVEALFGGIREEDDPYRLRLRGARHGTFTVELDTQFAHPSPRWNRVEVTGEWLSGLVDLLRELDATTSQWIGQLSEDFVPMEIVSPPMAWSTLDELSPLFRSIREAGATGSDEGMLYALGLHLNPEAATLEADWIARVLRAYVMMSAWLRRSIDIDFTRRVLPFIDPFPRGYARRIVDPDYKPDMTTLIDDYLADNATRNRELDMLPIFAQIDGPRVRRAVKDDRVNARPAFHYRLPNTRFTGVGDGPVAEWNRWVLVERLAEDTDLMAEMAAAFLDHYDAILPADWGSEDWADKSERFVARLVA